MYHYTQQENCAFINDKTIHLMVSTHPVIIENVFEHLPLRQCNTLARSTD